MAKQEISVEITAEQAYQEDLLADSYLRSGNPDFVKRALVMHKTFDARLAGGDSKDNNAFAQGTKRTIFEA